MQSLRFPASTDIKAALRRYSQRKELRDQKPTAIIFHTGQTPADLPKLTVEVKESDSTPAGCMDVV